MIYISLDIVILIPILLSKKRLTIYPEDEEEKMSKKKRAAAILSIDISTTMSMSGCSEIKSSKEISLE